MSVYNFTRNAPRLTEWIEFAAQPKVLATSGLHDLLQAVRAERIALTIVTGHRTVWTARSLPSKLPTIVLISDDNDAVESRPPDEWRCAISAIAWARRAMIHGTAKMGAEYIDAVTFAESVGRFLLIETESRHVAAWFAAIEPRRVPTLVIMPRPPGVHPISAPAVAA